MKGPETCCGSEPGERRASRVSRETESEGRNPRQLTELPHAADGTRDEVSRAPIGRRPARPSSMFLAQFLRSDRVVLAGLMRQCVGREDAGYGFG
jgi:hypothetical protein